MAIAMFCVEATLKEQAIVDMICMHRRPHNQKPRLNPDYYQRTIAKAFEHCAIVVPLPELPGVPTGRAPATEMAEDASADAPGGPQANPRSSRAAVVPVPDPLRVKAILWEALSDVFGIHILRITKFSGNDPIYTIDTDTASVQLTHVRMLRQQSLLSDAIVAQTERLIRPVKTKEWRAVSQKIFDSIIVKEGGEETTIKGSTRLYLDCYLSETNSIPPIEKLERAEKREPALLETHPGQISICASHFHAYLGKIHNQKLTAISVTSMLASIGSVMITVRGKGRDQSRWVLPSDDFSPAQYKLHIQEDAKEETA